MKDIFRKSALASALTGLLLVWLAQDASADDESVLLEALKTAILQGVGIPFTEVLEKSPETAVAAVEIKIGVLRNAVSLSDLSQDAKDKQLENLDEAAGKMSDIKARNNHPDQAKDPFIGRFTSNVPLGPTLPSDITLTLDPSSAAAFIVKPKIWDGGIAHPDVTDAFIRAQLGASGFTLSQHSYHIASFDILGMPSGPGTVMLRPGAPTSFTFNPSTGEFEAHYEGLMVNNLYPLSNPIVFLSDTSGIIQPDQTNVVEMTQDPWIVPGVPGKPALDKLGMAYIGTRAAFDPATGLLTFGDNVDLSAFPDVTVVREPDGNYISTIGGSEQLVGASYSISPLHFLGRDSAQRYLFADAMFSVFDANGLLAQGKLTDIGIDPNSFLFTGDAFFDMIPGAASSPFLRNFQGGLGLFQFLGSEATLDLLASTDSFTVSGASPSDFTNIHPTPEPATWLLLASGCLLWSRRPDRKGRRIRRGQDPIEIVGVVGDAEYYGDPGVDAAHHLPLES